MQIHFNFYSFSISSKDAPLGGSHAKFVQTYLTELLSGQDMRNSKAAIALKSSGVLARYETELIMLNFLAQKLASTDPSRRRQTSSSLPGFSEAAIRAAGFRLGSLGCSNSMMRFFTMNPRAFKKYDLQHPSVPHFFSAQRRTVP